MFCDYDSIEMTTNTTSGRTRTFLFLPRQFNFANIFVCTWFNPKRICHYWCMFNTLQCVFLACQMCIKCLPFGVRLAKLLYPSRETGKRCRRGDEERGEDEWLIHIFFFLYNSKLLFFVLSIYIYWYLNKWHVSGAYSIHEIYGLWLQLLIQ